MRDLWASAVAKVIAEFRESLGDLDPSKVLADLRIWVGVSRSDSNVREISDVLRELLEAQGAIVLPNTKPQEAFDDQLVLTQVKSADHIAMLAVTPGVSVEALELFNISKNDTEKMYVYMPDEYRQGYICDLLLRKHNGRKIKFFPIDRLRDPDLCRKMFYDALDSAVSKDRKRKMAPRFAPRIGIITALPVEFRAVEAILSDPQTVASREGSGYQQYVHGKIDAKGGGRHQIVLVMAGKGNNKAAIRTTTLLSDFPTVGEIFMVGIAAGVPNPGKPKDHVRLGDIVVSNEMGVIQYDMIKEKTDEREYVHPPRPPSAEWTRLIQHELAAMPKRPSYWGYLDSMLAADGLTRPKIDLLNDSPWGSRKRPIKHPRDKGRTKERPKVHCGPIGSANMVLKTASVRNALRDKFKLYAVEMEGSGIADAAWDRGKGYMIVRGICDYANDRKIDDWHAYAAFGAAAFTRQIIEAMPLRA
jgi:nucleoside phosphorylase